MATSTTSLPFDQYDGIARTTRCIAQTLRARKNIAVLLVWVTDFERVCASAGHLEAAKSVDQLQQRLVSICRDGDTVHRISECKFAVLLSGLKNRGHATLAARKIERLTQKPGPKAGSAIQLKTIIGIALGPDQGDEPHDLLRMAEVACLDARRGNDALCFFEKQSAVRLFDEWDLESKLKDALEAGDLELYLQPKTLTKNGEIVAAEALSRWHDPDIGPVSPEVFVDLAESTGLIVELTQFAIQTACRLLSEWHDALPELTLAVNVTPTLVQSRDIIELLRSATSIWGVAPERLTLEVTETALMDDHDASHDVLVAIREFGCRVSIDDFGTGYSSLAYLKEIPADELKIDRTFVMGMLDDPRDYKIVEHAINIANSFDLALRQLNCDYAQGYYISKPLPADEFLKFCCEYRG